MSIEGHGLRVDVRINKWIEKIESIRVEEDTQKTDRIWS